MHRVLRILSLALIVAGLVVMADIALTLVWKEPMSTVYGAIRQHAAADELEDLDQRYRARVDLSELDSGASVERQSKALAKQFKPELGTGMGIGRIEIPEIGVGAVVVEGIDTNSLQKGPGRYPYTSLPGEGRTIGIAGHRTTYLAPFRKLDELEPGDPITVEVPYGVFTYRVEDTRVVQPEDTQVVDDVGFERLVLTACHPLYSAAQRIVVFAKLDDINLLSGAGDAGWISP